MHDTGTGMQAEVRQRLFEPFFTTKGSQQGTGLGLATVHAIVQQHSGVIQVQSEWRRGSTFTVTLPYTPPSSQVPELASGVQPTQTSGTLLLAEDDSQARDLLVRMLQSIGYRVIPARDGQEAIGLFEVHRAEIQALVLDVVMPGLGGHQVARRIREKGCDLPILFISGYDPERAQSHALEQPAAFLAKPFERADLLRLLATLLHKPADP